ncbi:hypothetical protein J4457_01380 [Candidatus Woesearchaeota archaeon]|nr:hypothetical protein [Candidatus Woesearchaeota archaeon]
MGEVNFYRGNVPYSVPCGAGVDGSKMPIRGKLDDHTARYISVIEQRRVERGSAENPNANQNNGGLKK